MGSGGASCGFELVWLRIEPTAFVPLRPQPLYYDVVQTTPIAVPPMRRVDEQCPYAAGKGIADRECHYHAVDLDHPSTTGGLEWFNYLVVGNGQRRQAIFRDGVPDPKQIRQVATCRLTQNRGHFRYSHDWPQGLQPAACEHSRCRLAGTTGTAADGLPISVRHAVAIRWVAQQECPTAGRQAPAATGHPAEPFWT